MRNYIYLFSFLVGLLNIPTSAQSDFSDLEIVNQIKKEGFENSHIQELAFLLTDYTGPRLTGSYGNERGNEVVKRKMIEYGLEKVRIEAACEFEPGGWNNLKTYAAMIAPYYHHHFANPVAWTGSTIGTVKSKAILVDIDTLSDLDRFRGQLEGKIILLPATSVDKANFNLIRTRRRVTFSDKEREELIKPEKPSLQRVEVPDTTILEFRKTIYEFLTEEKVAAIINETGSALINIPNSEGVSYKYGDPEPIPQLNLSIEDFGMMERLLLNGECVEMEIEIKNVFTSNRWVYNVIGEIPGTDPEIKNEIVLIGAHLDSWHGGTGAGDNAAGCIVMTEAMRILKCLHMKPGRTIRIALWGGEEHRFLGSRAYVRKYLFNPTLNKPKPDYDDFSVYFNMDAASGKFIGIYMQGNDQAAPVFKEWLTALKDMDCTILSPNNYGNTDHISFDEVNLPGFSFIQEREGSSGAHHTPADTYEQLIPDNLKNNAVIMAFLAYKASKCDEKIPRKKSH